MLPAGALDIVLNLCSTGVNARLIFEPFYQLRVTLLERVVLVQKVVLLVLQLRVYFFDLPNVSLQRFNLLVEFHVLGFELLASLGGFLCLVEADVETIPQQR